MEQALIENKLSHLVKRRKKGKKKRKSHKA